MVLINKKDMFYCKKNYHLFDSCDNYNYRDIYHHTFAKRRNDISIYI